MNIILMYYNLEDKWDDEKKIIGGSGVLALKRAFKKANKKHQEKCTAIEKHLKALSYLEKQGCNSMDEVAEEFATIMREIFECGHIKDENERKTLGWMGYNLG
ncbi:MAG: hypothetical protein GX796_08265, partial [Clostridiaceae bacterium]|nr:hypothetical protein [Clostridiaceae bacterium]